MHKNIKGDTFSLQLTLKFENAPSALCEQLEHLSSAAESSETTTNGSDPAKGAKDFPHERCGRRRNLNRYLLIAANARGVSPKVMWIILYHHIAKTTGVHPVAESYRKGLDTHLDALMQLDGGYDKAMNYLVENIEKYSTDND